MFGRLPGPSCQECAGRVLGTRKNQAFASEGRSTYQKRRSQDKLVDQSAERGECAKHNLRDLHPANAGPSPREKSQAGNRRGYPH